LADKIGLLDTFKKPLIYTPGDNDWSDCADFLPGGTNLTNFNPEDQLALLRQLAYADENFSQGIKKMRVLRQPGYPENVMFIYGAILFVTFHVPSVDNCPQRELINGVYTATGCGEADDRDAANIEWLELAFQEAHARKLRGVVPTTQAWLFIDNLGIESTEALCGGSSYELSTDTGFGPVSATLSSRSTVPALPFVSQATEANPLQACSMILNTINNMAIVARGTCAFDVKLTNVLATGATSMLIINTTDDPLDPTFTIPVPIPVFVIGNTDGLALLIELESNPNLTITFAEGAPLLGSVIQDPRFTAYIRVLNELGYRFPTLDNFFVYGDSHLFRIGNFLAAPNFRTLNTYGPDSTSEGANGDGSITNNYNWASLVIDENADQLYKINAYDATIKIITAASLQHRIGESGRDQIALRFRQGGKYRARKIELQAPTTKLFTITNANMTPDEIDFDDLAAAVAAGLVYRYQFVVKPDSTQLFTILDQVRSPNDLDLYVFRDGELVKYAESNQTEVINMEYPAAGTYEIYVVPYCLTQNVLMGRLRVWTLHPNKRADAKLEIDPSRHEVAYRWDHVRADTMYLGAIEHHLNRELITTTFLRIQGCADDDSRSGSSVLSNASNKCSANMRRRFKLSARKSI